jgi:hypothetical protein
MSDKKTKLRFLRLAIILLIVGLIAGTGSFVQAGKLVVDFRQVANNDDTKGYATGEVHWIGSIVQSSNSIYYEGMDVGQRIVFADVPVGNGTHTLTLKHQFTKAGIHAYDWITSYSQMVADADALGVPFLHVSGGTLTDAEACGDKIGPPGTLGATALAMRQAGNYIDVSIPDDPYVSKDGSTAAKIAAYEAVRGDRTVRIYAADGASISGGSMTVSHDVADGADTGDSYALYELTWTSDSDQFMIEMAGHLAVGGDGAGYTWGEGLGSSSISGGPYHFKLHYLDTSSLGSQDNQIKGADILVRKGTKSGTKYEDFNADGQMNGSDAGLSGWTIAAFLDVDASNDLSSGDTLAVTNITDGNGDYTLTLDPGTYIVVEQVSDQATWFETPDLGTSSINTYDADYGQYGYVVTVTSGSEELDNDFGNWYPASKSGIKYEDENGNGQQDGGELGLGGWTMPVAI